ncbi:MAG: hypothetical protein CSA36_01670 [Draconibacterium sp.]|nr:MAG: hypothetical protein CSA36_01670 [Draconibacterium sp.]
MIAFGIKYWFVFLIVAFIVSAVVAFLLYYRKLRNNELSKSKILLLGTLRFLSFFSIALLLLSPLIRNLKKITQNPVVIVAWDNSESMRLTPDSTKISNEVSTVRSAIKKYLAGTYTVVEYEFGAKTSPFQQLNFNEKESNYGDLITAITNTHFNDNIGALLIAGDGIYNQGRNPLNLIDKIRFPVYSIGFGDTTDVSDARIQHIRVNRTAFAGNRFPVEVDALFTKLQGRSLRLSVFDENKALTSVVITPPNQNYFFTKEFIFDTGSPGLKHFTVTIETIENERNKKNNKSSFVINVLENKQKILIVSDGPHPDIGAIKNTLDKQTTYDVSVFTEQPYPSNISDYNLLILNQLPTPGISAAEIVKTAVEKRVPILFIVGSKTFLPQLNALDQGVIINPLAGSGEEALAELNSTYANFTLSENFRDVLPKMPPLFAPFADYDMDGEFTPLFYQKLKNFETNKPLIATGLINGRKTGFIFGEGLWRWRLYNYHLEQNNAAFNELINQIVQYLSLRVNEDNFIIDYKPVYAETDDIVFSAEVYNDAFERIASEEINMTIERSGGETYNYTFDIQGSSYYLNTGHLPVGDYNFSAEISIGNNTYTETGKFTVTPVNFEDINIQANFEMLNQLAQKSGGKFYMPADTRQLINDLKSTNRLNPTHYFQEVINELLNLKWVFFIVLLLLSMEWFLRKYWGIY